MYRCRMASTSWPRFLACSAWCRSPVHSFFWTSQSRTSIRSGAKIVVLDVFLIARSYELTPRDVRAFDVVKLTNEVTDCSIVGETVKVTDVTGEGARPLMRCRT